VGNGYVAHFPYRTAADHAKGLAAYGFSASDLQAIERDNAVKILPRLKQSLAPPRGE
jgi:hypothetical protein